MSLKQKKCVQCVIRLDTIEYCLSRAVRAVSVLTMSVIRMRHFLLVTNVSLALLGNIRLYAQ